MTEKKLAQEYKKIALEMQKESNDFLGFHVPLKNSELKNINIDKLINEAKKINLFIDYATNVKFIKCNKEEKNSIFIYLTDYNL